MQKQQFRVIMSTLIDGIKSWYKFYFGIVLEKVYKYVSTVYKV